MVATTELFSARWASALGDALAANASFREAARGWNEAVILERSDAPAHARDDAAVAAHSGDADTTEATLGCGVYLDLHDGDCRAARMATADDYATARFVLSATLLEWQAMLSGQLVPMMAILRGKLRLTKGSAAALMPHVQAASAVVRVAMDIQRSAASSGRAPEDVVASR
jgi:putative sterol carrier protein